MGLSLSRAMTYNAGLDVALALLPHVAPKLLPLIHKGLGAGPCARPSAPRGAAPRRPLT